MPKVFVDCTQGNLHRCIDSTHEPRLKSPQLESLSLPHAICSCRLRPPFSRHRHGLTSFDHVDDRSFSPTRIQTNNHKTTCSYAAPLICTIAQRRPNSFSSRLARHWEAPQSYRLPVAYDTLLHTWYDSLRGCPVPTTLDASEAKKRAHARMRHLKLSLPVVVQEWWLASETWRPRSTSTLSLGQRGRIQEKRQGETLYRSILEGEAVPKSQESKRHYGCLFLDDPRLRLVPRRC